MKLKNFHSIILSCIMTGIFVSNALSVSFTDYHLSKFQLVTQESSTPPSTDFPFFGYEASAYFLQDETQPEAFVTVPGGTRHTLTNGGLPGSLEFIADYFFTQFQLDNDFPSGEYQVELHPDAQTTQAAQITVSSGSFPQPLTLTNYISLTQVDSGQDLVLTWTASALTGAEDSVQVTVSDGNAILFQTPPPGTTEALPVTATSVTIPADTLYSFGFFTIFLSNHKVTTVETAQLPGITGTASLSARTKIAFETSRTSLPDIYAPLLIQVDPPNGATEVAADTPITFTFNEQMDGGISIDWNPGPSGGSMNYSWSEDGMVLSCSPEGLFSYDQEVRWTLNPTAENSLMSDTLGNPLGTGIISGTFHTTAVILGDAPEEYLPGPVSIIKRDTETKTTSVQVIAESLDGYIIQSSRDLETWTTIESFRSEATLAELIVPEPQSGNPIFYRGARFGTPLDFLTDDFAERGNVIYPEGGSVETIGSDGTRFTLTLPPGALVAPTRISITPLTDAPSIPLSSGLVSGVKLEPDGLSLMAPAELRMQLPAEVDPVELIGFQAKSDGLNFHWHPWTIENGNEIVMELLHFSAAGTGRGTPAEQEALSVPFDPIDRLDQELAIISAQRDLALANRQKKLANEIWATAGTLIQNVYDTEVTPVFFNALTDRNQFPCAIADFVHLKTRKQMYTGADLLPPTEAYTAIQFAWDESYQKCTQNGDFREVANLLWLLAIDQSVFGKVLTNASMQEINDCLSFTVDFQTEVYYAGWNYAAHHVLEAKDIALGSGSLPTVVEGSGSLSYQTFSLNHNFPDCDPAIKDTQAIDGDFIVSQGFIYTPNFALNGCDCDKSMDPNGWSGIDFSLLLTFISPQEFWQECKTDSITGESSYIQNGATLWNDSFVAAHEEEINFQLTGSFYDPLYVLFDGFDFINTNIDGRRKVAQKQIFRFIPGLETIWTDFENTASETLITIWYTPPGQ